VVAIGVGATARLIALAQPALRLQLRGTLFQALRSKQIEQA